MYWMAIGVDDDETLMTFRFWFEELLLQSRGSVAFIIKSDEEFAVVDEKLVLLDIDIVIIVSQ